MELTDTQREVLRGFFLFKDLPEETRERVFSKLSIQHYKKAQPIYTQSRFQNSLGILLSGEAAVYKDNKTLLNLLKPGSCFGAAALFAPAREYVTSVISNKDSTLAFLPGEELAALLKSCPDAAMKYITFLSGRIQFLNKKIDSFTTDSAEDAVWIWLSSHADSRGCITVDQGFSRLARELSIGRASLYRALNQLEEENKIVKNGAEIQLCSR